MSSSLVDFLSKFEADLAMRGVHQTLSVEDLQERLIETFQFGKLVTKDIIRTPYPITPDVIARNRRMSQFWKDSRNRRSLGRKLREAHSDPSKYRTSGRVRGYFFSCKNNRRIPYRSSYELAFIKQLESDPLVVSYDYEPVRIPYLFEGRQHTTRPDFLVHYTDGHTELVEVKAGWCIEYPQVKSKIEGMKKYASEHNWTFRLVTEF